MGHGRRILTTALIAVGASLAVAWQETPSGKLPDLEEPVLDAIDDLSGNSALAISDLRRIEVARDGPDLVFQATLARPFREGIFAVFETYFDCDDNQRTGTDGCEVATNTSAGSRFRPNAFRPTPGLPAPLDLVRSAYRDRGAATFDGESSSRRWTHRARLLPPLLGGTRIRWRVPMRLLQDGGLRYGGDSIGIRVLLETTCSEHPLVFEYDAKGTGRPIKIDGRTDEWSGGPYVEDEGGELHPVARFLDIRQIWCEHGKDRLFFRVEFDAPGFGKDDPSGPDVTARDELVFLVQPVGERYMEPRRVSVSAATARSSDSGVVANARGASTEVSIRRSAEQTHFRISVWTDARRQDWLDARRIQRFSPHGK